jgi:hypothetical protein
MRIVSRPGRTLCTTLIAAVMLLGTAACGGGDGGDEAEGPTTTAEAELTSFETVADVRDALAAADMVCDLEYEGLKDEEKEVSRCVIEGQQSTLYVYSDPEYLADFIASNPTEDRVALGQNWEIDVATAEVARQIAEALGGTVPAEAAS